MQTMTRKSIIQGDEAIVYYRNTRIRFVFSPRAWDSGQDTPETEEIA